MIKFIGNLFIEKLQKRYKGSASIYEFKLDPGKSWNGVDSNIYHFLINMILLNGQVLNLDMANDGRILLSYKKQEVKKWIQFSAYDPDVLDKIYKEIDRVIGE